MTEHQEALFQAAYDYTSRGLRVIALTGKAPNVKVHRRGLYDAFGPGDLEKCRAAFGHPDTTGIGILTGDPYYVVDIDGEEGAKVWSDILGVDVPSPDSWVATTGRGMHLWYAHSKDWCDCRQEWRTTKLGEKLDFKGAGGYVAAPPSLHPNGNTYRWLLEPEYGPPMEMPKALHDILHRAQVIEAAAFESQRSEIKRKKHSVLEDGLLWATVSFNGIIDKMRSESEGNRNGMLYWCARTMLEEGAEQSDLDDLADAAMSVGLSGYEIRQTLRSARGADRGR
jgi:hypothetical protein